MPWGRDYMNKRNQLMRQREAYGRRALAQRMQPKMNDPVKPVIRRQGIVLEIQIDPFGAPASVTIELQGTTIPAVRFLAGYRPTVGDVVIVDITNDDPLVLGKLHSDPQIDADDDGTEPPPGDINDYVKIQQIRTTLGDAGISFAEGNSTFDWSAFQSLEIFGYGTLRDSGDSVSQTVTMSINSDTSGYTGVETSGSNPLPDGQSHPVATAPVAAVNFPLLLFQKGGLSGRGMLHINLAPVAAPISWISEARIMGHVAGANNSRPQAQMFQTTFGHYNPGSAQRITTITFDCIGTQRFAEGAVFTLYGRR